MSLRPLGITVSASDKSLKANSGLNKYRVYFFMYKGSPEIYRPRLEVDIHHEIKLLLIFYTVILSTWLPASVLPHGQKMTDRGPGITSTYQAEKGEIGRAKGVHFS